MNILFEKNEFTFDGTLCAIDTNVDVIFGREWFKESNHVISIMYLNPNSSSWKILRNSVKMEWKNTAIYLVKNVEKFIITDVLSN